MDSEGPAIWIADAHRDDGKRFVVRADEKLTAFMELERTIYQFAVRSISGSWGLRRLSFVACIAIVNDFTCPFRDGNEPTGLQNTWLVVNQLEQHEPAVCGRRRREAFRYLKPADSARSMLPIKNRQCMLSTDSLASHNSPVCSCVSMTLPDVNGMSFTAARAIEIDVHTPFGY